MDQPNRWHPCLLPDNYLRKLKQDLSEVEALVESEARCEQDQDAADESQSDEGQTP